MLHVKYNSGIGDTYHIQDFGPLFIRKIDLRYLDSITIDGDEAVHIMNRFGQYNSVIGLRVLTIPWNYYSHANSQTYYGDIAKTILANL